MAFIRTSATNTFSFLDWMIGLAGINYVFLPMQVLEFTTGYLPGNISQCCEWVVRMWALVDLDT